MYISEGKLKIAWISRLVWYQFRNRLKTSVIIFSSAFKKSCYICHVVKILSFKAVANNYTFTTVDNAPIFYTFAMVIFLFTGS